MARGHFKFIYLLTLVLGFAFLYISLNYDKKFQGIVGTIPGSSISSAFSAISSTSRPRTEFFRGFDYSGGDGVLGIDDVFIAVKTTLKNHRLRLPLLMDTWIPQALNSVSTEYYLAL